MTRHRIAFIGNIPVRSCKSRSARSLRVIGKQTIVVYMSWPGIETQWRECTQKDVSLAYLSTTVSPLRQGQVDKMCFRFSGIKVLHGWRLYETVSIYVMLCIHFWNITNSRVSCLEVVFRVVQSSQSKMVWALFEGDCTNYIGCSNSCIS